jgi:hypothetical protein
MISELDSSGTAVLFISGRAGVAIVEHDGRLGVLSVESKRPFYPALTNRAAWLAGLDDVEVETADRVDWASIHGRLRLAWRVDRAVQLFLSALDGALVPELRLDAATLAARHLTDREAGPLVRRRLFAAPLPEVADTHGLLRLVPELERATDHKSLELQRLVAELNVLRGAAAIVARAWDEARIEMLEDPVWLAEIRPALIEHGTFESLNWAVIEDGAADLRIADDIPNRLAVPRVERFVSAWVARVALAAMEAIHTVEDRAWALAVTTPRLPEAVLPHVLGVAEGSVDADFRARVLATLAPRLPAALLPRALAAAETIEEDSSRAEVLVALAPRLPAALLPRALAAAEKITDVTDRAWVLAELAPHLPDGPARALFAVEAISDPYARVWVLGLLAAHLPDELLPRALAAAEAIDSEEDRVRALEALALRMQPHAQDDSTAQSAEPSAPAARRGKRA